MKQDLGNDYLVSWCSIENLENLDGIWAAYISRYHSQTGTTPIANFGRSVNLYGDSVSPSQDERFTLGEKLEYRPVDYSVDWGNWREVTERDWMGLDWSQEFRKSGTLQDPFPRNPGVFRVRTPGNDRLDYIGASVNIHNYIYENMDFSGDQLISFCELDLSHSPRKNELQAILLGAHYLAENSAPGSRIRDADLIQEQAASLIKRKEDSDVEFKQRTEYNDDSIGLEIVALANDGGGHLFIGVTNSGDPIGLENIDDLDNKINDWCSDRINPSINVDTYRPEIDGKQVLWVRIPPATDALYNYQGEFKRRSGTQKEQFHWNDLEDFLRENPHILIRILQSSDIGLSENIENSVSDSR